MASGKYHVLAGFVSFAIFASAYFSYFSFFSVNPSLLAFLSDYKWIALGLFLSLFGSTLCMHACMHMGYRTKIATNINAEAVDYSIRQIDNMPDLKQWLRTSGRKLFILDEAGKHIRKLRFMTQKNILIMDIIQLIRHYDCGFIGCAPSETFIDNNFLNTDILDAKIRKLGKKTAKVYDYLARESYFLFDIPPTSIKFNSKDIADFKMQKRPNLDEMQECCRVAYLYAEGLTYEAIGKQYHPTKARKVIRDLLRKHLEHALLPVTKDR